LFGIALLFAGLCLAFQAPVKISWDPNAETDLAGYKIYLNDNLIADVPADQTSWTGQIAMSDDMNVIVMTAYDDAGQESGESDSALWGEGLDPNPKPGCPHNITIMRATE